MIQEDFLETIYRLSLEQKQDIENLSNQLEAIAMNIASQMDDLNNKLDALDAAILDISKK